MPPDINARAAISFQDLRTVGLSVAGSEPLGLIQGLGAGCSRCAGS